MGSGPLSGLRFFWGGGPFHPILGLFLLFLEASHPILGPFHPILPISFPPQPQPLPFPSLPPPAAGETPAPPPSHPPNLMGPLEDPPSILGCRGGVPRPRAAGGAGGLRALRHLRQRRLRPPLRPPGRHRPRPPRRLRPGEAPPQNFPQNP